MSETVTVANYRSKLEAELAAGVLESAGIPYVIQSMEGLLHGPLGPGATILVRAADGAAARELLDSLIQEPPPAQARVVRVARYDQEADADRAVARLTARNVPYLTRSGPPFEVFVRLEHEREARAALEGGAA